MNAKNNRISGVYIAKPENAAEIRKNFKEFFESLGLPKEQVYDMLLAMGEMVVNAIEHAYHGNEGLIQVCACFIDNTLSIVIEDFGDWVTPEMPRQITRGRGIFIAEILTTKFDMIHKREGGTRVKLELDTANS
jgi:anti-sigma regulatory factor (Ser/Thr protein kinase)